MSRVLSLANGGVAHSWRLRPCASVKDPAWCFRFFLLLVVRLLALRLGSRVLSEVSAVASAAQHDAEGSRFPDSQADVRREHLATVVRDAHQRK